MNIFKLADQNSDSLNHSYCSLDEKCKKQGRSELLNEFTMFVRNKWCISINMHLWVLNEFLTTKIYRNVYELKKNVEKS